MDTFIYWLTLAISLLSKLCGVLILIGVFALLAFCLFAFGVIGYKTIKREAQNDKKD